MQHPLMMFNNETWPRSHKRKKYLSHYLFSDFYLTNLLNVFLKEILPEYYPQINFTLCFKNYFTIASLLIIFIFINCSFICSYDLSSC